ncbi:hypothetical protein MUK51_10885 [Sphingobacterium faecium]|uniref:hypothetical protein n=1 Tax=Sphingobacterium faecium TaxID=34087 RepID=UPI0021B529AE|nr:hypothetical protein [Sphingobacterium faecium]UXD67736.1 hypothetical protein MUK51_10885 [Sphingobacterium faecium]
MRISIILIVCILMSGCGLFRKTTKIDKSSVSVSTSSDVKVTTDVKVDRVEKSTDKTITSSERDDQVKVYPKPGTEVKIAADGSMTLEADSIISNTKKKTDQARDLTNQVTTNLQKKSDSIAAKDSVSKQENYKKDIIKEPSVKGVFSNWIGWALGVLIIAIGLIWYLKKK